MTPEHERASVAVRPSLLSVVVPVYGSESILPETHRRLRAVLTDPNLGVEYEILFVNDGSPDNALNVLRVIADEDPCVRVLSLSRNFGHQVAITAGMDHAQGDAVVIIDDDLQDPPEVIAEMVVKWREGYRVVYGVRSERRGEHRLKRATAALFYRMLQRLSETPLPVDSGDYRLLDRTVVEALRMMQEESRYMRGMVAWVGFSQTPVYYARDARYSGRSNYTLRKLVKLAFDGILSFSSRPLSVAIQFGMFVTLIAMGYGTWLVIERLANPGSVPEGWTTVIVAVLFMGGIQLLSVGVLGAYLGRIFFETKSRPLYFVAEQIGADESPASVGR
ncbi:MAG: glycosyltransferase family 2 protein [Actinomycetota bacterium]|nr:glycosyltransferase family 2 protein [Actinomycetota bacterium]